MVQQINTSTPSMVPQNSILDPTMSPQNSTINPSISPQNSTSYPTMVPSSPINDLESNCPGGFKLVNSTCTISETFEEITSSKRWRVWATKDHLNTEEVWDINDLAFYDNYNCIGSKLNDGKPIESGHYPSSYVPARAFDGNTSTIWGGQEDEDSLFWLGMEYNISRNVSCVSILDIDDRGVREVRVQAWQNNTATWQNAMIVKLLQSGQRNNITLNCPEGFELRQSDCVNISKDTKSSVGIVVGIIASAIAIACAVAYIYKRRLKTEEDNSILDQQLPTNHSITHLNLPVVVADQFIMPPSAPSSKSIRVSPETYIIPPPTAFTTPLFGDK